MRGIRGYAEDCLLTSGATPTYVGNTKVSRSRSQISGSHPHLCGEYNIAETSKLCYTEPPPLVRGILIEVTSVHFVVGATPTCAGNTQAPAIQLV